MTRPLILTGYLGKDPETRQTQERVYEGSRKNPIAQVLDHYTGRTRSREYIVMSLATHQGNQTAWYRLVVWSSDQICHRNIRFAGQGDLVKVQAWHEVYRFKADDGTEHEIRQHIVARFRVLKRKHVPPEIP
jgi:single-stranded DNA-binding protein